MSQPESTMSDDDLAHLLCNHFEGRDHTHAYYAFVEMKKRLEHARDQIDAHECNARSEIEQFTEWLIDQYDAAKRSS